MPATTIHKSLELRGRDEVDLERRLGTFQRALHARRGAILDVRWHRRPAHPVRSASVRYQVELLVADDEALSA